MNQRAYIEQVVVTAEQTSKIESRLFEAGMPVAALMEKVAGLISTQIQRLYPRSEVRCVGIIVGPGHNGGDALVVARELHLQGYEVLLYRPIPKFKDLPAQHAEYAASLGIPCYEEVDSLLQCDLIVDGLFGFGQTRPLEGDLAAAVDRLNESPQPMISIDLPSGIHTDTGEVLGTAIRATHTFCLGLWKLAFFQDQALDYLGTPHLIDYGIPAQDVWAVLGEPAQINCMTANVALDCLPLFRPNATHKYKQGHLLVICGSSQFAGGAILTGLGARASGIGMLSIAVPESLKPLLVTHLPEALIVGCPETETGAIARLPEGVDLDKFSAVACGPGLTLDAQPLVETVLGVDSPLVLDADGLNCLAEMRTIPALSQRQAPTVLTPHPGEFKRLFPDAAEAYPDRITAARKAAERSRAIVLFKGARTAIADPGGSVWLIPQSTPALARGGSGDVLTGLLGGLMAQPASCPLDATIAAGAWWHAQAGILAARERTELGVDSFTLSQYLIPVARTLLD